jgi:hypothetical protein
MQEDQRCQEARNQAVSPDCRKFQVLRQLSSNNFSHPSAITPLYKLVELHVEAKHAVSRQKDYDDVHRRKCSPSHKIIIL